jgi:hypothetical protein
MKRAALDSDDHVTNAQRWVLRAKDLYTRLVWSKGKNLFDGPVLVGHDNGSGSVTYISVLALLKPAHLLLCLRVC